MPRLITQAPILLQHLAIGLLLTVGTGAALASQLSIHDPVMAREDGIYYLFSTDPGIKCYSSTDRITWKYEYQVFHGEPAWARSAAPGFNGHIWAPDILFHNGKFYLTYSVSAFGKNTSAIGLTVNKTLNPKSPDYKWEDQGIVIQSIPNRDLWNAIDPNIIIDESGTPWMSFGSYWGGLKLVKLDRGLAKPAEPQEWYTIAKRERPALMDDRISGPAELEAPFIYKKGDYYYLFISWDKCCRGKESTYRIMVGRSKNVRGPYLDQTGKDLAKGGGTLLLSGNELWAGPGHNSVYNFDGVDILVFHAYEKADNGLQKLKLAELIWDQDGWPFVDPEVLNTYQSILLP